MIARHLFDELESHFPETCKVPGRFGGYVRVAVQQNCEWYRRLCRKHLASRKRYPKPRTIIRRCHTLAALKRIAAGNAEGVCAERLMPFIEEREAENRKRA